MKGKSLRIPAIIIAIGIIVAIAAGLLVSMQKMPTVTKQDFHSPLLSSWPPLSPSSLFSSLYNSMNI